MEGEKPPQHGLVARLAFIVACIGAVFHLWTGTFGISSAEVQRATHVIILLTLTFLIHKANRNVAKESLPWYDVLLILGTLASCGYMILTWDQLKLPGATPVYEQALGVVLIIVVLESARRSLGNVLPLTAIGFLIYAFVGPWLPGFFAHQGYSISRVVGHVALGTNGIFGIPVDISATYIVLFVVYGAVLEACGAGQLFLDVAYALPAATAAGRPRWRWWAAA